MFTPTGLEYTLAELEGLAPTEWAGYSSQYQVRKWVEFFKSHGFEPVRRRNKVIKFRRPLVKHSHVWPDPRSIRPHSPEQLNEYTYREKVARLIDKHLVGIVQSSPVAPYICKSSLARYFDPFIRVRPVDLRYWAATRGYCHYQAEDPHGKRVSAFRHHATPGRSGRVDIGKPVLLGRGPDKSPRSYNSASSAVGPFSREDWAEHLKECKGNRAEWTKRLDQPEHLAWWVQDLPMVPVVSGPVEPPAPWPPKRAERAKRVELANHWEPVDPEAYKAELLAKILGRVPIPLAA